MEKFAGHSRAVINYSTGILVRQVLFVKTKRFFVIFWCFFLTIRTDFGQKRMLPQETASFHENQELLGEISSICKGFLSLANCVGNDLLSEGLVCRQAGTGRD